MLTKAIQDVGPHEAVTQETPAVDAPAFLKQTFHNDGYPVTIRRVTDRFFRVNRYRPDYRGDSIVGVFQMVESLMVEVDTTPDGFVLVDHTRR